MTNSFNRYLLCVRYVISMASSCAGEKSQQPWESFSALEEMTGIQKCLPLPAQSFFNCYMAFGSHLDFLLPEAYLMGDLLLEI